MLSFCLQLWGPPSCRPFSGDILYYWRHFTGYRKRLPNLISASWFQRNSRGIWVILILFCWNHRNLKWSVGFCLDQCTISHRAFSLTWRTSTPIYWEKRVYIRKELTPTGLVWNTNMAAVSFFWNNNMAAVTSCENAILNWLEITFRILDFPLYHLQVNWFSLHFKKSSGKRAERPAKLICPWT